MQRLVYSPKIQAYIKTDDGVIDITDFIVSGTIQRVVNEVSTAELVIRNPGKRFTQPGNPTFLPMDAITIFGSRHKGRPVQMFTGYLDTTPYLQLYPGTCTLRASCTLKRLMYTYWDAGLPYTWDFLKSYGWVPDPTTGTTRNPQADKQKKKDAGGNFTDGSIGNLMFGVLKQIGQWDDEQILIEEFPKDADDIVKGLIEDISGNVTEAQNQFDKFLTDIIGQYSGGGTVGGGGGTGLGARGGTVKVAASFYDLPGVGSCGDLQKEYGHAYAELGASGGVGDAMGGLKCGYEIDVTYKGKTVTIQKCDTGSGGSGLGGAPRAIDVTLPVAQDLGFVSEGVAVVEVSGLPPGTKITGATGETVTVPDSKPLPDGGTPGPGKQTN